MHGDLTAEEEEEASEFSDENCLPEAVGWVPHSYVAEEVCV